MTEPRLAIAAGLVAAMAVDLGAYLTFGQFRVVFTRHHWILYLYLSAGTTIVVGSLAYAAARLWRKLASPRHKRSD